jgi:tripartite-type tricarboxylate transporter receptor subunit TctC
VKSDAPWKTLKEFVDYAKINPGKLRVGVAGVGVLAHFHMEQFNEKAGINLTIVPYTGDSEAATQLLGGHIEANGCNPASLVGQARAGNIRLLALTTEKRDPQFPDIPTFKELGYDLKVPCRYFIIAPKKTQDNVILTLHDAFKKAIESESFKAFAVKNFFEIDIIGPTDLTRALHQDYNFFGDLVKRYKLSK